MNKNLKIYIIYCDILDNYILINESSNLFNRLSNIDENEICVISVSLQENIYLITKSYLDNLACDFKKKCQ